MKRKGEKVGLTKLTVRIVNPAEPRRYRDVELIVDSGAHFKVVPKEILKEPGIRPRRKRSFLLANGERFERKMGNAEFEYKGEPGAAPVVFGENGDFPLLGVTTLEALGLLFDPVLQELKPLPLMML